MFQRLLALTFCILAIGTFTGPALAIPIAGDYTLTSTLVNGSFTSDGNMLTAWSFTTMPATTSFTGLPPSPANVLFNNPTIFTQATPTAIVPFIDIVWNGTNTTGIVTILGTGTIGTLRDLNASANPIPEPSTMLLFGSGLAGLAAWRYRKSVKS